MLKLIKLELKKVKIGIKGIIIANLIILASILLIIFTSLNSKDMPFNDYDSMLLLTGTIVRAVFMIFAAALISRLIIGEYKNKTINVMFLYPIQRRKIMVAKLFIVVIFTFITMFLSNLFLNFILYILYSFITSNMETMSVNILLKSLVDVTIYSLIFAFISLIPVYVGMWKKSGTSTIVSGVILVSILNSGSNNITLSSYIIIPIIAAFLGIISSYMAIKDIEDKDVIC